jgi:beta-glucosidase/6-phospho-beta-glucosidase/beta-galactosidase
MRIRLAPVCLLFVAACSDPTDETAPPEDLSFPDSFVFGTATAGFQVDMGCPTLPAAECEDPGSDWYAFVTSDEMKMDPKNYLNGDPPSAGPGHWELYEKDFDLAKDELHTGGFRMSIEWSRIFPTQTDGVEGYEALKAIASAPAIDHYHKVFAALKARGIAPLVTLNHYTLPTWIHDAVGCHKDLTGCSPRGWVDKDRTVAEIAKYAGFVAQEFGGEVDRWATLNEPFAVVLPGYLQPSAERSNPPSVLLKSDEAKVVMNALIEAHARMYDAVKAADNGDADEDGKPSEVGVVYAMAPIEPVDPENNFDKKAAENIFYLFNLVYLNAVVKGDLDHDLDGVAEHRADLENRMDYLGINYYFRVNVVGTSFVFLPELSKLTTFDPFKVETGGLYPKGIYDMAMLAKEMGVPAYITENGLPIALDDDTPTEFLVQHLTWVKRAIRDGADIRGYYYWSLLDNYEWNHGMDMRFGLYAVEKDDPLKLRSARQFAKVFGEIAQTKGISPELAAEFPAPE